MQGWFWIIYFIWFFKHRFNGSSWCGTWVFFGPIEAISKPAEMLSTVLSNWVFKSAIIWYICWIPPKMEKNWWKWFCTVLVCWDNVFNSWISVVAFLSWIFKLEIWMVCCNSCNFCDFSSSCIRKSFLVRACFASIRHFNVRRHFVSNFSNGKFYIAQINRLRKID